MSNAGVENSGVCFLFFWRIPPACPAQSPALPVLSRRSETKTDGRTTGTDHKKLHVLQEHMRCCWCNIMLYGVQGFRSVFTVNTVRLVDADSLAGGGHPFRLSPRRTPPFSASLSRTSRIGFFPLITAPAFSRSHRLHSRLTARLPLPALNFFSASAGC